MIHVVLVEPQIPPNTGNIARLCAGLGLSLHLIKPLGFSLSDRYLKRAGLDYWPHVKLHVHDSWDAFRQEYPEGNFYYLTTKSKRPYTSVQFQKGDFLVFGSETTGLPAKLLTASLDNTLTIPITGPIRSFNLSSTVAMVVGEAVRQITPGRF
ncbi:MAG: tRNA (cytidine(34)-2'-O)-methyltransferase [Deltaproteobacteria bacterium]|nr:tRNA (cytidine(34)-2'-O)-methyltransferase [Deltaproteobacteria bacterium]